MGAYSTAPPPTSVVRTIYLFTSFGQIRCGNSLTLVNRILIVSVRGWRRLHSDINIRLTMVRTFIFGRIGRGAHTGIPRGISKSNCGGVDFCNYHVRLRSFRHCFWATRLGQWQQIERYASDVPATATNYLQNSSFAAAHVIFGTLVQL